MRKILKILNYILIYIISNIIFIFMYDKKYKKSKYFKTIHNGVGAIGWEWVISDAIGRIIFKNNIGIKFPVSPRIVVKNGNNIIFDPDDLNNFQGFGNYYQATENGKIYLGKSTFIAPNVGLITTNHDVKNPENHQLSKDIRIGDFCWIGMNSIILPGVILGAHTTVGAGSVVTKSFEKGNCIIVGNPAKIIKLI